MMSLRSVVTSLALAGVTLLSGAKASAAEVSSYHFIGPSMSAGFHRVTLVLCSNGTTSAKDETIYVSAAKFRERLDGQASPDLPAYVTIFSLDGCTGVYSFGSADLTSVHYSQGAVQTARLSGRASVADFSTGASLGDINVDIRLDGAGPIASDGGHATTDYGDFRVIEVWQGKARSAALSGSVTLNGAEFAGYFEAPIYALSTGHYQSTTVTK